jgi:hypothetical protein
MDGEAKKHRLKATAVLGVEGGIVGPAMAVAATLRVPLQRAQRQPLAAQLRRRLRPPGSQWSVRRQQRKLARYLGGCCRHACRRRL